MLAEKRSISENLKDDEDSTQHQNHQPRPKQSRSESPLEDEHELLQQDKGEGGGKVWTHEADAEEEDTEQEVEEEKAEKELMQRAQDEGDEADDSERSPSSSSSSEKSEFVFVELSKIRNDVQCPICLGIIKKTRTVMECLHRFCRECIDKSMRLGNNECPACRTHCASRRSLRDDPNYDALIAALYPDIDKYEEEELAFHEEERTRNKQIQESIAQIFQRQSEALIKRRTVGKDIPDVHMTRTQRSHRNAQIRRRKSQGVELQGSEDNDRENENNNIGKDSSSTEDHHIEFKKRKRMKRAGGRSIQPSSSVANSERGYAENNLEMSRENRGISPGLAWNSEMLAWGKGGVRSHTRHGNANGSSSKIPRNSRLSKLIDYLRSLKENADELDIHLMLISLDKNRTPDLQKPLLCCHPSLSVKHLCETLMGADEIELMAPKGAFQVDSDQSNPKIATTMNYPDMIPLVIDSFKGDMQILKAEETLEGIRASCTSFKDQLILVYRRKDSCEESSLCG